MPSSRRTVSVGEKEQAQLRTWARNRCSAEGHTFLTKLFISIRTPHTGTYNKPTLVPTPETVKAGLAELFPPNPSAFTSIRKPDGSFVTKAVFNVIRHGQATGNVPEHPKFTAVDCPLTSEGGRQVTTLKQRCASAIAAKLMRKATLSMCSPLRRCEQTCDIFNEGSGDAIDVWIPAFREQLRSQPAPATLGIVRAPGASSIDPDRELHGPCWSAEGTSDTDDAWEDERDEAKYHLRNRAWEGVGLSAKTAVAYTALTGDPEPVINIFTHGDFGKEFMSNVYSIAGIDHETIPSSGLKFHNAEMKRMEIWFKTDVNEWTTLEPQDDGKLVKFHAGIDPTSTAFWKAAAV